MKKFLLLFLLLIPFSVKGIVKPTNEFYVNDYANILSHETEEYIMDKSLEINKIDGTQIVVLTVPNLEGMSIEDYANKYFNDNGIGDKDKNNGLLIMVALKERLSRIEVGDGFEGILPDGKTGRFQDEYMIPYFRKDNFDKGMKNGYNAFFKEIVELNHLDLEYNEPDKYKGSSNNLGATIYISVFILCLFLAPLSAYLLRKKKYIIPIISSVLFYSLPFYDIVYIIPAGFYTFILLTDYISIGIRGSCGIGIGGGFFGGGGHSSGGGSTRGF